MVSIHGSGGSVKEDRDALLPSTRIEVASQDERSSPSTSRVGFMFKAYVIISMTFLWTGYTLTVRFTRSTVPASSLYAPTTVVLTAELIKLAVTVFMIYRDDGFKYSKFSQTLSKYYFNAPREVLKMSVPSIAYALQNNLDFVGLSNLDAGVYQVTTQLKVVTTAIFMMLFLGRRFSTTRWAAILLLFAGVACVQLNNVNNQSSSSKEENYFVGISAVLATCVTAGFAGVYFEMMLKDGGSTPFWMRNLQLYSSGAVVAALGCFVEYQIISERGFFFGYDFKVCCIVGCLSVGGLYISMVMKYLDNLYKSFASAVSIILVVLLSWVIFPDVFIGAYFVLGTMITVLAILLYNSVVE